MGSADDATTPGPVSRRASVFIPLEHGSWALALEPLALALLVAPSPAGGALAGVVLAAFFARRPLKACLDPSVPPPTHRPYGVLLLFGLLALAGLGELFRLADAAALWPLLLAVPFGGLFAYFDAQGESRAAAAELAGSAAFALLPVAFATLGGWRISAALALAAISLTRSIPTVLTIRSYLRLRKGKPVNASVPLLAAALGLALISALAAMGQVPWLAAGVAGGLLVRTVWMLSPRRPAWTARRVGMAEAVIGLGYVLVTAFAYHATWHLLSRTPA